MQNKVLTLCFIQYLLISFYLSVIILLMMLIVIKMNLKFELFKHQIIRFLKELTKFGLFKLDFLRFVSSLVINKLSHTYLNLI